MGLEEKRKIKELQDKTFPDRVKEITEICGQAISYDVDWNSLADDAGAFHSRRQFRRIQESLRVGRRVPLEHQGKIVLFAYRVCDPKAALTARVALHHKAVEHILPPSVFLDFVPNEHECRHLNVPFQKACIRPIRHYTPARRP